MNAVYLKELRELCEGNHHSMWCNVFSRHQCTKLNRDDLEAGYRIPGILTGIVLFGLVSMVLSVWLAI
jgi:hypothetical protein